MGFDCVWITPVVDANGFMGYDAVNIFDIEPHFGTKESYRGTEYLIAWPPPPFNPSEDNARLKKLKQAGEADCGHHVAEQTECACFPGNMGFNCPSLSPTDFSTGYLGVLGDLNHSNPFVRQTLLKWVHEMVQNYSLDALRLDTAVYLDRGFLPEVQEAAGVQVLGEATVNNLTFQASLMHGGGQSGLLGLLNFPPFYQLPRAFCGYRIGGDFGDYSLQGLLDLSGEFCCRIRQALVWVFLSRGIPILYYGTEQGLDGHQGRWFDALSGKPMTQHLKKGCFEAPDKFPKDDVGAMDARSNFTGEHPFGFSILTAERTYELFTHSYQDAELWVSALNAARDIANGKVPVQASTASVPRPACEGNDT
ncbi:unnamed protein product [Durusdinium trenchii]|uniref:PH domain-containing protein n=1 Tax=Durusdinium trenchii TaxID=1381693 RepID=A0ABP0LWS9_9DINO